MKIISLEKDIEQAITDDSYIIRIIDQGYKEDKILPYLNIKTDYDIKIKDYTISNNLLGSDKKIWKCDKNSYSFNKSTAKQIIDDFRKDYSKDMNLIIHCLKGIKRAHAIGIALNETFDLSHDTEELKKIYPNYSPLVYKMIKEASI